MDKWKSCPFCGGPEVDTLESGQQQCWNCGARGPKDSRDGGWNDRAQDAETFKLVEALKDLLTVSLPWIVSPETDTPEFRAVKKSREALAALDQQEGE